jgi:hypothetical protein
MELPAFTPYPLKEEVVFIDFRLYQYSIPFQGAGGKYYNSPFQGVGGKLLNFALKIRL